MKNLIYTIVFVFTLSITHAFESSKVEVDNKDSYVEYVYLKNSEGEDTCYARFCWNVSETQRRCSDWVEVPCDAELQLESTIQEN